MYKAFKLGVLALGLAIFIDILFYKQMPGLNVPLASLAFIGATYLAMYIGGHKLPMRAHLAAVFSFLFALPFAIGTSEQMFMLSTLGFLASHLLFAAFAIGHEAKFSHPLEILWSGTGALGLKLLGRLDFLGKLKPPAMSAKNWAVGKGLLVLLPLLVIFIALFASADPVFNSYFANIGTWLSTWSSPDDIVVQVILIAILFTGLVPFFAAAAIERFAHEPKAERNPGWVVESKIILIGLAVLFALFLILQGSVMFGGSAAFAKIDMTYAEYARQGFNQLILASALVAVIVLTLRDQHGAKSDNVLTLLHGALIVETLLILVSAAMRLNLYIATYGYTDARLFAYWTIITIGIMLVLLLANVLQRESQTALMNRALVVLGISALIFCYSMPDAMSARMNFRRTEAGQDLDFLGLMQLSPEATPVIVKALQTPKTFSDVEPVAARNLIDQEATNDGSDWRSWNYSNTRANDLLPAAVPDWLQAAIDNEAPSSTAPDAFDVNDRPR